MEEFKLLKKKLAAEAILRSKYEVSFFSDTILNVNCSICTNSVHRQSSVTTPNENFYCRNCLLTNLVEYKRPESPTTNKSFKKKSSFSL